jgi:RNA polymerase sigma-70 factor (ECF subfamily)
VIRSAEFQRAIGLAQAGDPDAMHDVLVAAARLAGPLVRRIAGDDADDVLQGVLWTVARKLSWLDEPLAFRAWVFRVASRAAVKHVARVRRLWPVSAPEDLERVAAGADPLGPTPVDRIPELLEAATPRSRAVLVLHYLEELPLDEVAAVLGLPIGTVKSRLAYGLRLMREAAGEGKRRT